MGSWLDRSKVSCPENLAAGVTPPAAESREEFILQAVSRFGDDELSAAERWYAARRLISDGDLVGLGKDSESRARAAWLLTPREAFIPSKYRSAAYLPQALPVGHNQTISAPYMVSRMTAALNPGPEDCVLEIGTGSGYQSAILSAMSRHVHTIENVGPLAAEARSTFEQLAERRPWLNTILQRTGNGYEGWSEKAPFDRIVVTCAIDHVPQALAEQTASGGMIIIPLGDSRVQRLTAVRRRRPDEEQGPDDTWQPSADLPGFDSRDVYRDGTRVVFVPFVH